MSGKVGRNDPCPCGSGKKYKKCCALRGDDDILNISLDPFTRYNERLTEIKLKLDTYYANEIKRIRRNSRETFLFYTVDRSLPAEHESLYSDWLWFDWHTSGELSMAERYLQENGSLMDKPLQECLQSLCDSSFSIYKVIDSRDMILQIRDLFTNEDREVLLKEPWQSSPEHSILIVGRLVRIEQAQIFSGMVLLTEDPDGQKEGFLTSHYQYAQQLELFPDGFPAELIYGLFDHAHKKKIIALRDMRMTLLDTTQAATLQTKLSGDLHFEFAHFTDQVAWYVPKKEHYGYVRLVVGEDYVATSAEVLEDVIFLQEQIKEMLPQTRMDLVHSIMKRSFPPVEKADIWLTIMKDQQAERWLDTTHHELDDQTPRQLLAQTDGKDRLLAMLQEFSGTVKSEEELAFIDFMRARVESAPIP
jgi:hypothetical protein